MPKTIIADTSWFIVLTKIGHWLRQTLTQLHHDYETKRLLKDLEASFPSEAGMPFLQFRISPAWLLLREKGLLLL